MRAVTISIGVLAAWAVLPAYGQPAGGLRVELKESEKLVHPAGERTAVPILVTVFDERDRPVPGAVVSFSAPEDGPSARFVNGASSAQVLADDRGEAQVLAMRSGNSWGDYTIRIAASFEGKTGRADASQFNERPPRITRKRVAIAGVAGAAVIVPLLALRSPQKPKATVSTVTPTGPVGPP
jgi:hypothetical protein